MIAFDEDALICDLAETYGIFNYKALPVSLVATLSVGLRENSRIKMKMTGMKIPTDTLLLASSLDKLALLAWLKTEDAVNGTNRPKSIVKILTGIEEDEDIQVFESPEQFEKERERILRKVSENG